MTRLFHLSRRTISPPLSPAPPPNTTMATTGEGNERPVDPSAPDTSRVRTRLHALFTPDATNLDVSAEAGPSSLSRNAQQRPHSHGAEAMRDVGEESAGGLGGGEEVSRSITYPVFDGGHHNEVSPAVVIPPKKERDAIKVLVVTWNMGDALPKGDLSVLLGHVPPYQPPSPSPGVPTLPVENAHPYHIVVVAGQECPTPSGAPRGLGGGLMKGVTLRHKREMKEKERNREKEKEKDRGKEDHLDVPEKEGDEEATGLRSPNLGETEDEDRDDDGEAAKTARAGSPMTPHTPFLHRHTQTSKGWSQMLDDYLCGPNATNRPEGVLGSLSPISRDSPLFPNQASHAPPHPTQPSLLRSASAPVTPTTPMSAQKLAPGPSHLHLSASPLARSQSSFGSSQSSSSSSSDSGEGDQDLREEAAGHNARIDDSSDDDRNVTALHRPKAASQPVKPKLERPEIVIPVDEVERSKGGNGSYIHVAKERLLGMYLSVYVYKGCEHLIQGVDKDFVTAGLAGGRVGNKGGIGISLKLAEHRFLFVNSHLAAHTNRQAARLANIAKIKAELRLDCFLPTDDPRATAEDITERFDTVFWCGDLNFRLELSRLHADWLIEQKKYAELLMWDQLKLAMKHPESNPFPGFEEGPIDFPCTFKYDVWKSVRATNRDRRRSMRRRKSSTSAAGNELPASATIKQTLSHVPEDDHHDIVLGDDDDSLDRSRINGLLPIGSDDDSTNEDATMSRRSFDSSRYTSTAGTDFGDDDCDEVLKANTNQHRHRAFEVVIKEKTRHFLGLVKMDGILTPSPAKRGVRRHSSTKRKPSLRRNWNSNEFDPSSRRTSMSSFASTRMDQDDEAQPPRPSTPENSQSPIIASPERRFNTVADMTATGDVTLSPPVVRSEDTIGAGSPPRGERRGMARRLTLLKRTVSTKSVREGVDEHLEEEDARVEVDDREGVYDTSKKQRVPSWCDRVLWKAHVEPDPEPDSDLADAHLVHPSLDRDKPFHRLSTVFSNLGGHLKLQMGRTTSMEPSTADRTAVRVQQVDDIPAIHPDRASVAETTMSPTTNNLSTSPNHSPGLDRGQEPPGGLIPSPRRSTGYSLRSPLRSKGSHPIYPISKSGNISPAKLTVRSFSGSALGTTSSHSNHESSNEHIRFGDVRSPPGDRLRVTLANKRPRSHSDGQSVLLPGSVEKEVEGSAGGDISSPATGSATASLRQNQMKLLSAARTRTISQHIPHPNRISPVISNSASAHHSPHLDRQSPPHPSPTHMPVSNSLSIGAPPPPPVSLRDNDRNAFRRFLRDIPGWLHRSSLISNERTSGYEVDASGGEKRWRKGEVRCLHYGTIDDAGMRLLEGRSDHRPAIFAGAVYI